MFKRLLARLFGRKPKPQAMTSDAHMRKIADAMIVEIAKRPRQPIHHHTFSSGPARNSADVDITSPLHPAWMATLDGSGHSHGISCHSHSSHDSGGYDSGSSDSGSSSGGCD